MAIQRIRLSQIKSQTVNYQDFDEQVVGMGVPFYQEWVATEGQTDFILDTNYKMGIKSIKVFLNGVYQDEGVNASYIEVDEKTIRFNDPLYLNDWVMVRIEGAGNGTTLEDHIHHVRETPVGVIDGVNTVFELHFEPKKGTEHLYKNGMLMHDGVGEDYNILGKTITFLEAPLPGAKLLVTYIT